MEPFPFIKNNINTNIINANNVTKLKIGLFGGSFNPAHEGHVYISIQAINKLYLNYIVWLISPQNPLKILDISNTLNKRVEYAKSLIKKNIKAISNTKCESTKNRSNIKNTNIIVSDIEQKLKTNYTEETIIKLINLYPNVEFVWIMGADNMVQIHKWKNWKNIFKMVNVAVFDREGYSTIALESNAAQIIGSPVILNCDVDIPVINMESDNKLKKYKQWYFIKIRNKNISSSDIRKLVNVF